MKNSIDSLAFGAVVLLAALAHACVEEHGPGDGSGGAAEGPDLGSSGGAESSSASGGTSSGGVEGGEAGAHAAGGDGTGDGGDGTGGDGTGDGGDGTGGDGTGGDGTGGEMGVEVDNPLTDPEDGPPAGYDGGAIVPADAAPEDSSAPDHVVGDGTPESCTSQEVVDAVAQGGVITFDCGDEPVTIMMEATAKVFNDQPNVVLDGGGLITLSGMGARRILYMNTCDQAQVWTTPNCDNQDHPELSVQNITFIDGNAKSEVEPEGGAVYASGGRFKVVNSRFFNNVCADVGPDVGGGALRAFQQYDGQPVYVVNSTFGGEEGLGNVCSNGGALSSIGVSWTVINSLLSYNHAIGDGGNPAQPDTPGGGSGGAIYNDGETMTLGIHGSLIEYNEVNAYGSAIFFVTNDHSGNMVITDSTIKNNIGGSWYPTYPQISNHDDTPIDVSNSTIE